MNALKKQIKERLDLFNHERFNQHYRNLIQVAAESNTERVNDTMLFIDDLQDLIFKLKESQIFEHEAAE